MPSIFQVSSFILICFVAVTNADCGCNKLKRENVEKSNLVENDIKDTNTQTCSIKNKSTKDDESASCSATTGFNTMSRIPGGNVTIGTMKAIFKEDHESPERFIKIKDFFLDKYEVSNRQFREFVDATGYVTDAEKFGDSFVFKGLISEEDQEKYKDYRVVNALWWYKIDKVDWKHPEGINTEIEGKFL